VRRKIEEGRTLIEVNREASRERNRNVGLRGSVSLEGAFELSDSLIDFRVRLCLLLLPFFIAQSCFATS
jgi:hypothetical protein